MASAREASASWAGEAEEAEEARWRRRKRRDREGRGKGMLGRKSWCMGKGRQKGLILIHSHCFQFSVYFLGGRTFIL